MPFETQEQVKLSASEFLRNYAQVVTRVIGGKQKEGEARAEPLANLFQSLYDKGELMVLSVVLDQFTGKLDEPAATFGGVRVQGIVQEVTLQEGTLRLKWNWADCYIHVLLNPAGESIALWETKPTDLIAGLFRRSVLGQVVPA